MMHVWVSRRLSASLDGELPPPAMLAVERHILRCRRCARSREGLRRAREAVQAAPRSAPPPDAWSRLREQMAAPAQSGPQAARPLPRVSPTPAVPLAAGPVGPAPRRTPAWAVAAAAAGVLAALAASVYLGSGSRPPAPPGASASFVTTADLMDQDPVSLSPSLELLLVARQDGGANPGEDR